MIDFVEFTWCEIVRFVAEHWDPVLTACAFVISLFDLCLHIASRLKDNVRLQVMQTPNSDAYSFPLVWYDRYDLLFCNVQITNLSRQPVTLADIRLISPDGTSYPAEEYTLGDHHNPSGLTLYNPADRNRGCKYNLKTENLLSNLRFDVNDSRNGYLIFFGVPPIKAETSKFRITARAGKKHYSVRINVSPLPDNLKPWNDLPRK